MQIHLVNPSDVSFGTAVITPRWMYVLAGAMPRSFGDPVLIDETLERLDDASIGAGDVVGIGIHTGNARRGYEIGRLARARGASVVFGGIHATLYPDEAHERGEAHAVVQGDGEVAWAQVLDDCANGRVQRLYQGGRVEPEAMVPARWDLLPHGRYMWASVQTVRGCPKHCSFCSVWRTDGQKPRQRSSDRVIEEIVALRRLGIRFMTLADDNFYPVTRADLAMAARRQDKSQLEALEATRAEQFELMARLAELPRDTVFYTQITMEAAEDPEFLRAMRNAHIRGALVGIESVTPQGLRDIHKQFNSTGDELAANVRAFREAGIYMLGSFIFGLPSDDPETFEATVSFAEDAGVTIAQFLTIVPLPGTLDFNKWEAGMASDMPHVNGIPMSRYWLIPQHERPRALIPHPAMSAEEIRRRIQMVWDRFYRLGAIWRRSDCVPGLRGRLAFALISKLYRQMYANTGLATDSARVNRSMGWARWLAKPCQRMFAAAPMPDLQVPPPRRYRLEARQEPV